MRRDGFRACPSPPGRGTGCRGSGSCVWPSPTSGGSQLPGRRRLSPETPRRQAFVRRTGQASEHRCPVSCWCPEPGSLPPSFRLLSPLSAAGHVSSWAPRACLSPRPPWPTPGSCPPLTPTFSILCFSPHPHSPALPRHGSGPYTRDRSCGVRSWTGSPNFPSSGSTEFLFHRVEFQVRMALPLFVPGAAGNLFIAGSGM